MQKEVGMGAVLFVKEGSRTDSGPAVWEHPQKGHIRSFCP